MSPYTVPQWRALRLAAGVEQNCNEPTSRSDRAILGCAPRMEQVCGEHHLRLASGFPSCDCLHGAAINALGSFGQHEAREDAMHLAHIPLLDLGMVFALSKGDMLSESISRPSGT